MVSDGLSGNTLEYGLVDAVSGFSKFDAVDSDSDSALLCFCKLSSPLPRSFGLIAGLAGLLFDGVCSGVFVLEFHTPLTSQSLSIALMPKGTSFSCLVLCTISPLSAVSAVLSSENFLIRLLLCQRIPKEKMRTAPCPREYGIVGHQLDRYLRWSKQESRRELAKIQSAKRYTYKGNLGPCLPTFPERHHKLLQISLKFADISRSTHVNWILSVTRAKIERLGRAKENGSPKAHVQVKIAIEVEAKSKENKAQVKALGKQLTMVAF